jgi:malonyl-CoA/methylmalonyl-CoA synthetase
MRLFTSGSAPLLAETHVAFEERTGHRILERYGMTETLMSLGNPYDGERRAGTVGWPFTGVETRIVDERGDEVAVGTVGELMVKSPMLCAGYWNQPELTAKAFSHGWFHTGDLAMRSDDGYYTLCGRRSDLIISGGFNIYPREIEELLCEHPAVAEAAVAGVPDQLRGEVPMGFVVLAEHATAHEADLIDFCRTRLASFKVPRAIRVVDRLPRTALGKVQKTALVRGL